MGEFDYIFLTGMSLEALNFIFYGNYSIELTGGDMIALMVKIILLLFTFVRRLLDVSIMNRSPNNGRKPEIMGKIC